MSKMKIGIIDADLLDKGTRHPNLALMKISGYYKGKGHKVVLLGNYLDLKFYDKVYIAKVFSYTFIPADISENSNVILGGTGFYDDGGENLSEEIEHHMPDYELYKDYAIGEINKGRSRTAVADYLDYSIGYASRGCFRKCPFCVNKKYDKAFRHSPIKEFYNSKLPYIYLWDDNFLACSDWEEILEELNETGKPFQFRQGLDIRLMTEAKARRLSEVRYHGDFIFAFDYIKDRDLIEAKLKLWKRYNSKIAKLYLLCAYDSQDENDIKNLFERIWILMKHGCLPYIMRYNKYKDSQLKNLYIQIARWCNQPQFFKKKSFRQFCEANQSYHKNKATMCSSYKALIDFEQAFPDIAHTYFDLRFDEENRYSLSFGYGRRYANKPDCNTCEAEIKTWENAHKGEIQTSLVIEKYYTKEMDFQCFTYPETLCSNDIKINIAEWFCDILLSTSLDSIFAIICNNSDIESVLPSNIPQFSDFRDAYIETPRLLCSAGYSMTYDELGVYLDNGKNKSIIAQRKYGENHSKLATLLDLAAITINENAYKISCSVFGEIFNKRNPEEKKSLAARLILRIPIIQSLLSKANDSEIDIDSELISLSSQTKKRRKSNIAALIQFVYNESTVRDIKIKAAITQIRGWR